MLCRSSGSLLAAAFWSIAALVAAGGCSNQETVLQQWSGTGSVQLAVSVGDRKVDTVNAVLSRAGDGDFPTQTQSIDVRGEQGVVSVFFGDLPVGSGYAIELSAGACSGSASFSIQADTTTVVEVSLTCGSAPATSSAQITGSINAGAGTCDLIAQLVAAPAIQSGDGAPSQVEVVLRPGVSALVVSWVVSPDSSARIALDVDPASRLKATVDCQSNGAAELTATVQALSEDAPCSEQARARIECRDQPAPAAQTPPGAEPDAGPAPALTLDCSGCTRDFCAAQLAAVNGQLSAVAPILACVAGPDWQRAARATASSCANTDLFGCYCGSVAPAVCVDTAPAAVDGPCRDLLLAGSGCSESACLQTNLLNAATATGSALQYAQCQQDFCYDLCFNP